MNPDLYLLQQNSKGFWQHPRTERVYQVLTVANKHSTRPDEFPITVVYQDIVDERIWSLPIKCFVDKFDPWQPHTTETAPGGRQ